MKIKPKLIGLGLLIGGGLYLAYQYSSYQAAGGNNGVNGTFYAWLTYS